MIDIHLTAQEAHALYNVTAGIMRRGASTPELGSVARKLRGKVAAIVCCDCGSRVVYSQGGVSAAIATEREPGLGVPQTWNPTPTGRRGTLKGGAPVRAPPFKGGFLRQDFDRADAYRHRSLKPLLLLRLADARATC